MNNLTFITGGARSGKSLFAQTLACGTGQRVYYLATMEMRADDEEQLARVARHRAGRPPEWHTVECGRAAARAIESLPDGSVAVLDCLSLFISNFMVFPETSSTTASDPYSLEAQIMADVEHLLVTIERRPAVEVIVVSNEVGWGVVPETSMGRAFRDLLGQANQLFAGRASQSHLLCAGIPLRLK